MERLTYRVNTGIQDVVLTDGKSVEECLEWKNVLERLAGYEDIGLTPEQLREIDKLYAEKCNELADAKLPCAVGDTVYADSGVFGILEYEVDNIVIGKTIMYQCSAYSEAVGDCSSECLDEIEPDASDFGKTVFLTREEAEAALKEAERRKEENETD